MMKIIDKKSSGLLSSNTCGRQKSRSVGRYSALRGAVGAERNGTHRDQLEALQGQTYRVAAHLEQEQLVENLLDETRESVEARVVKRLPLELEKNSRFGLYYRYTYTYYIPFQVQMPLDDCPESFVERPRLLGHRAAPHVRAQDLELAAEVQHDREEKPVGEDRADQ